MEREINLMEPELPQLRQMVLKNTERIDRNERLINRMMMEQAEQSRTIKERDEWWENSRREHERDMREMREILHQTIEGIKELREKSAESAKRRDEDWKKLQEKSAESAKRRDEDWKKLQEMHAESDKRMDEERKKTDAQIRQISIEFLGVTGHLVEGLASSAVDNVFKEAGLELLHYGKNIKPKRPEDNKMMEIDVLLGNDNFTVPVEVKADFTKKKVKRFVHKMTMFRKLFPEYCDKDVVAAVAAINYENGADTLAHEEGLLVIRVSSDDIFTLDPFDIERLRRF